MPQQKKEEGPVGDTLSGPFFAVGEEGVSPGILLQEGWTGFFLYHLFVLDNFGYPESVIEKG